MKNKVLTLAVAGLLVACGAGGNSADVSLNAQAKLERSTKTTALTAAGYQNTVQSLYIAYFGRPADPTGLANFEAALLADGAPTDVPGLNAAYATNTAVKTLMDSFGTSKESQTLYGGGDATAFVTAVFKNVLGRGPQTAGLSFWVNAITSNTVTQGQAALSIMAGALTNTSPQGVLDAQLVANRVIAANYFTTQVSATNSTSAYTGATAAGAARGMLSAVTAATDLAVFQTQEAATITGLPNYPTIRGTTSPYSGTSFVAFGNASANSTTILDAAGNKYAVDSTSGAVVAQASGVSLDGLTVDVHSQGDNYIMSGGNIVGVIGYAPSASNTTNDSSFFFTANSQIGIGQINLSSGSYSLGCNSSCESNVPGGTPYALQEIDSQVGTGAEATFGKTVTVNYNAWRFDISAGKFESTPFDSSYSRNQPFAFVLGAGTVIEGWDQGVIGMKVGGTRTLIIPSLLGYGANGAGSTVPPDTPLMFTVTLLSVQ